MSTPLRRRRSQKALLQWLKFRRGVSSASGECPPGRGCRAGSLVGAVVGGVFLLWHPAALLRVSAEVRVSPGGLAWWPELGDRA